MELSFFQWALDPPYHLPIHICVYSYCSSISLELCAFKAVVYLALHMDFRVSQCNRESWCNPNDVESPSVYVILYWLMNKADSAYGRAE